MGYIIVGTIIGGIIWGIVVNKVIENKGYKEDWFWWGFFFGIFALIVALTKQSVNTTKVVIESSAPIKENMELLSSCILNDKVNVSSPVHIASWEIKKDAEKLVLFVDFINVSLKAISAVMFSATGFNSFGDRVQINGADLFDVIGQDLSIKANEYGKVYATLQDAAIRKVEVKVKKVCFTDGTIVDDIQDEWININQSELKSIHIDCARRENAQSKYYAIIKEHYWQCICGFVNTQNTCAICGMQKNNALKFTQDNIDGTYNEYLKQIEIERLEEEKRKLEEMQLQKEQQAQKEERKRIIKKRAIIISTIALISIVIISTLSLILTPIIKYNYANMLLKNGKYNDAKMKFAELMEYKDSDEKIKECVYLQAIEHMKSGDYTSAKRVFSYYKQYKNSDYWLSFIDAVQLEEIGELNKAYAILSELNKTNIQLEDNDILQSHLNMCEKYKIYCGKWRAVDGFSKNVGFEESYIDDEWYSYVSIKGQQVQMKIGAHGFINDIVFLYEGDFRASGYYSTENNSHKYNFIFSENVDKLSVTTKYDSDIVDGWKIDETSYLEISEYY